MNLQKFASGLAASALIVFANSAMAQSYPTRNITFVVPFAAGSGADTVARILGQYLGPALGTVIVVENKVGAAGMIAANAVARAEPDGYTLIVASNSTHGSNPSLFKTVTYDPVKDFAPIGRFGSYNNFVLVNPQLPIETIQDLVSFAKANPGKLSYGAGSTSTYIMGETLKRGTGIDILRVPYRSNPAVLTDLIGGQISVGFADISSSLSAVEAKQLRALAVTSAHRSEIVPGLPTVAETLIPGFDIGSWSGLLAPAKTPQQIVDRINAEMNKILARPEIRQRLLALGIEPQPTNPAEFGIFVRDEVLKWSKLAKDAGVVPE